MTNTIFFFFLGGGVNYDSGFEELQAQGLPPEALSLQELQAASRHETLALMSRIGF